MLKPGMIEASARLLEEMIIIAIVLSFGYIQPKNSLRNIRPAWKKNSWLIANDPREKQSIANPWWRKFLRNCLLLMISREHHRDFPQSSLPHLDTKYKKIEIVWMDYDNSKN